VEYNLYQKDMLETEYETMNSDLGLVVVSPLASGILTTKYRECRWLDFPQGSRASLPGFDWLKQKVMGAEGQLKKPLLIQFHKYSTKHDIKPVLSEIYSITYTV